MPPCVEGDLNHDPSATHFGHHPTHSNALTDERGSVLDVTNAAGVPTNTATFDPYGGVTSGNAGAFGYTSAYTDPNTGLLTLGVRNYDTGTSRFTQTDPTINIGSPGQANTYTYAGADPTNNADPTGRVPTGDSCAEASSLESCEGTSQEYDSGYPYDDPYSPDYEAESPVTCGEALTIGFGLLTIPFAPFSYAGTAIVAGVSTAGDLITTAEFC